MVPIAALVASSAVDPTVSKAPVLIFLYTRFEDFTHPQLAEERIDTLLPALQKFRMMHPQYGASSVFEFSGAMSEVLSTRNEHQPPVEKVKDYVKRGLIEVGYAGESEPTYANRPKPDMIFAETAEDRWRARAAAAESFLTEYKDPLLGDPIHGVSGGLRRMQEVFGTAAYITGLDQKLGGNSPLIHQLHKLNQTAILEGLPDPDPNFGIEGYRVSATTFGRLMSPAANTSPELYYEDGYLHSSETDSPDIHTFSTADGPEKLKAAFAKLDRSKIRVIHMEYGSYLRYLRLTADGTPRFPPLKWTWDHPSEPEIPTSLAAMSYRNDMDAGYKNDAETLKWLEEEFFPANPGSRFVSCADLKRFLGSSGPQGVTSDQLKRAATDLSAEFAKLGTGVPNFAQVNGRYFSLVEMFQMLSAALAGLSRNGALPDLVRPNAVYGPLALTVGAGAVTGEVTVASVAHAAAEYADRLRDAAWKPVPDNVIPSRIVVDNVTLNPGQFLQLMAMAYLDPTPDKKLKFYQHYVLSAAGEMFPKNIAPVDQGNTWTYKPAPLHLLIPTATPAPAK